MNGMTTGMPLWARLRITHGFARTDEVAYLQDLKTTGATRSMADCAPSGCETSGSKTGGCKAGTSCLLSGLQ